MLKVIFLLFIFITLKADLFTRASNLYEKKDFKKSFKLYEQLAYAGNVDAQYNIAIFYYNGIGVKKDKVLAFIWLSTASKRNHRIAQNKLAYMYEKGEIPNTKNKKKALEEYLKSAKQNYDIAQLNLGMHYNQIASKDALKQAFFWYTKSCNNGNIPACNNLANMYYFGQSVKTNYKEAAKLYKKAAKANDKIAQYNLAMMYFSGEYFEYNGKKSLYWLEKSSIAGYKVAQVKLATFYKEGNNILVDKDYKKAFFWYYQAARQNYAPAQYYLGYLYFYGYGVKIDLKKAAYYMHTSHQNGYENAKRFMKRKKLYY